MMKNTKIKYLDNKMNLRNPKKVKNKNNITLKEMFSYKLITVLK